MVQQNLNSFMHNHMVLNEVIKFDEARWEDQYEGLSKFPIINGQPVQCIDGCSQ